MNHEGVQAVEIPPGIHRGTGENHRQQGRRDKGVGEDLAEPVHTGPQGVDQDTEACRTAEMQGDKLGHVHAEEAQDNHLQVFQEHDHEAADLPHVVPAFFIPAAVKARSQPAEKCQGNQPEEMADGKDVKAE